VQINIIAEKSNSSVKQLEEVQQMESLKKKISIKLSKSSSL
jgi:hypothetical protein